MYFDKYSTMMGQLALLEVGKPYKYRIVPAVIPSKLETVVSLFCMVDCLDLAPWWTLGTSPAA